MGLHRVMRLERRDVNLVNLDRRACESSFGFTTFAFNPLHWPEGRHYFVWVVVSFEVQFDVRHFGGVCRDDGVGSGFGGFKRLRHGERDVLAVITNNVSFEWRPPLFADAREARPWDGTRDSADVAAMQDSTYTGHRFGCAGVELCNH